jgi:hypothetical protein
LCVNQHFFGDQDGTRSEGYFIHEGRNVQTQVAANVTLTENQGSQLRVFDRRGDDQNSLLKVTAHGRFILNAVVLLI